MDARQLEGVLRSAGVLPAGHVVGVEAEDTGAFNAAVFRLRVRYSPNAPTIAPTALVVKRPTATAWSRRAASNEIGFYALAAQLDGHPSVLAPLVAAGAEPDPFLLLVDLSATHAPPVGRAEAEVGKDSAVPDWDRVIQVVRTLARLHGYWWANPALKRVEPPYWSAAGEGFAQYRDRRLRSWQQLLAGSSEYLPAGAAELYEWVFARLDNHWRSWLAPRVAEDRALTLVHGDAYFANFLTPRNDPHGPAVLLDWQTPSSGMGATDLVNMLATFWTGEQRADRRRELRVLEYYHAQLCAAGVRNYSFSDLCSDYRRALVYWLLVPVQDAAGGARPAYWVPKMSCLMTAFGDWNCQELLE